MTTPLHPAMVHLPLGLSVAMPLVAFGLAFALWRGLLPRRAWLVAVVLQAALLGGGAVAFRTGAGEEHTADRVVSGHLIEEHEDRAEAFLWAAGVVLTLAAAALVLPARMAPAVAGLAAAGSLAVAGLGFRTGKAGGELVYRHGAASAYTSTGSGAQGANPGGERGR